MTPLTRKFFFSEHDIEHHVLQPSGDLKLSEYVFLDLSVLLFSCKINGMLIKQAVTFDIFRWTSCNFISVTSIEGDTVVKMMEFTNFTVPFCNFIARKGFERVLRKRLLKKQINFHTDFFKYFFSPGFPVFTLSLRKMFL